MGTNVAKHQLTVAVLGLGEAGSRFANDLAERGVRVLGWDPAPRRELHPAVTLAASNAEATSRVPPKP